MALKQAIRRGELARVGKDRRALAPVLEWAVLHRNELRQSWEKARLGEPLDPVEPLE